MPKKQIRDIEDLPGVGDKTAEKLKANGYKNLLAIATTSPWELKEKMGEGFGDETADKVIQAARDAVGMGFKTAEEALKHRETIGKISTGSKNLDTLLGGGVETQAITEAYGSFGSSKTQLAFQLAINVQKPKEDGGMGGGAIFIDTENTFRPERLKQLAEANGVDPEKALKNVFFTRAFNSDHQITLVEKDLEELVENNKISLVIIDSLTSHFRSDYSGRGELAERQQILNKHMHALQRMAERHNLAVYITNQVMADPSMMFGDPTRPIGGHIVGHQSTYRVYLRKSKGEKRIARMIDSPHLPEQDTIFTVTEKGIGDPKDD